MVRARLQGLAAQAAQAYVCHATQLRVAVLGSPPSLPSASGLAASARGFASSVTRDKPGIYELRTYTLYPDKAAAFLSHAEEHAALRLKLFGPHLLGFFTTDVGGCLHEVKHLYHYDDLEHREQVRKTIAQNKEWAEHYVPDSRQFISHQGSLIFVEATDCHEAAGSVSAVDFTTPPRATDPEMPPPVYELRTYQCHLGYDTVPKLRQFIAAGLPSKVEADKEGKLVLYAFSDVGDLNKVIELWRYSSTQGSLRARQAARTALPWREAIGKVAPLAQSFNTQFMFPVSFSKWH